MVELSANAGDLETELAWFAGVLDARFQNYFHLEGASSADALPTPPTFLDTTNAYARFLNQLALSSEERLALVLALVPHLRPRLLDVFHTRNTTFDRRFTEFGGIRSGSDGDFAPTGETLAFILGGDSLEARLKVVLLLGPDGALA
ncbi:MAG: hypothetical protein ABW203_04600, partial [Novosphingobium sp.]